MRSMFSTVLLASTSYKYEQARTHVLGEEKVKKKNDSFSEAELSTGGNGVFIVINLHLTATNHRYQPLTMIKD